MFNAQKGNLPERYEMRLTLLFTKTAHSQRKLADYAMFKHMNSTDGSETRFHVDPKAIL